MGELSVNPYTSTAKPLRPLRVTMILSITSATAMYLPSPLGEEDVVCHGYFNSLFKLLNLCLAGFYFPLELLV